MSQEKDFLARRGVDFRSASDLSMGRPMSRFFVTLNPLGVMLAPFNQPCCKSATSWSFIVAVVNKIFLFLESGEGIHHNDHQ
jgi:hypothetical protein